MKYFLSHHKKWLKCGPKGGICSYIGHKSHFKTMTPSYQDIHKLILEGKSQGYWGSGLHKNNPERWNSYTPLRQNIVLFCAAMNGEL